MSTPRSPPRRRLRYALVILGLLVVVGSLAGIKFLQISRLVAYGKQKEAEGPPPESVGTARAETQTWERTLRAVGTVARPLRTELRNEVPGVIRKIAFNSGSTVKEGAVLVEIDARIERSQLAAARARRDQAETNLRRSRQLRSAGALAQAALDEAETAFRVAEGEVARLEAVVAQKVIRAPFAGRLGIREVSKGQFLAAGTRITVLDAMGDVFVDFQLPQEDIARIAPGIPVRVSFAAAPGLELAAQVVAVEPTVNVTTRNLQARARIADPEEKLKPGMFVDVTVVSPERMDVVAVPATAIVHAAYGDSVFVIEDKKPDTPGMDRTPDGKPVKIARQQFVRVGAARGDFVQILRGLQAGAEVVTAGAFKLRNGSPVVVNPSAAPRPELNPKPENR